MKAMKIWRKAAPEMSNRMKTEAAMRFNSSMLRATCASRAVKARIMRSGTHLLSLRTRCARRMAKIKP